MKKIYLLTMCALLGAQVSFAQEWTPGVGDGLTGSYWKGATNFDKEESEIYWSKRPQGTVATWQFDRVDPTIDFEWGNGNPFDDTEEDFPFCIEWNGYLLAPVDSYYTFDFTHWDNGFYFALYDLDDLETPIATNEFWSTDFKWDDPSWTAECELEGGKFYKIVVRYYEDDFGAHARMAWYIDETSVSIETVPQSQLYTKLPGSSVGEINATQTVVSSTDGAINVYNLNGEDVAIYNLTGYVEYGNAGVIGDLSVELPSGIYIVKVGSETHKVIVR